MGALKHSMIWLTTAFINENNKVLRTNSMQSNNDEATNFLIDRRLKKVVKFTKLGRAWSQPQIDFKDYISGHHSNLWLPPIFWNPRGEIILAFLGPVHRQLIPKGRNWLSLITGIPQLITRFSKLILGLKPVGDDFRNPVIEIGDSKSMGVLDILL